MNRDHIKRISLSRGYCDQCSTQNAVGLNSGRLQAKILQSIFLLPVPWTMWGEVGPFCRTIFLC